mgnify:CR=1 FL=1|tara:strand:+ start:47 stop:436 length:390 start_codon:yes stop_codon:yes gene_type:complete
MATQIVIGNQSHILIDNDFHIDWADKGKNWNNSWLPSTIHCVIWNDLPGQNEIQNKDANEMMTGNTDLSATSDAVGTTTIADLLTWAELRQLQIEEAELDYGAAKSSDIVNGTTNAEGKSWKDYDPNYS